MMASKNVYTAEIVTLQDVFGKSKADVALAMTYYFIVYAVVQLLLSTFISKINLKVYLTLTAIASSILTMLIALGNFKLIYVLCACNGALQAGIYSGCMSVISKYLLKKLIPFANAVMSSGSALSGCMSYGASALFVAMGHWELGFIVLGGLFFASAVVFFIAVTLMKKFPPEVVVEHGHIVVMHEEEPFVRLNERIDKIKFVALLLLITFTSNCAHYAILNWMPDMLHELFGMPQSYSILITLVAPLVMLAGSFIAIFFCEKTENILKVNIVLNVVSIVFYIPLIFVCGVNIILTLLLLIVFIGSAASARVVFGGIMAMKMRSQINTGGYIASTNAMASIAAGVMPPIAGSLISSHGYSVLFIVIFAVLIVFFGLLGTLNLFVSRRRKSLEKN
jgi:MHS family proline/betaine transporter-like MFS transporter